MHRRSFIKAGAALAVLSDIGVGNAQDVPSHNWDRYDFGSGPKVTDRLNQGPFGIEQDEGWYTVLVTSQSEKPVKNYGLGLVGYTWEESGPSLAARNATTYGLACAFKCRTLRVNPVDLLCPIFSSRKFRW